MCVANDIPAAKKTVGFSSHASTMGCSQCTTAFEYLKEAKKTNTAGSDYQHWKRRSNKDVIDAGVAYLQAKTNEERSGIVKTHGVKYSPLHNLSYFKPIKQTITDPMHNLFSGVAKTTTKVWLKKEIIATSQIISVQSKMETSSSSSKTCGAAAHALELLGCLS